ncbi:hypothetical protein VP01_9228g1 [Puccinia sorghi]|uniref:Uncharacterized protein n=1 Tax=Puccinia sorghi TaxID=27349 RepID=A0A0L6U9D7_9BASI|nr:hypothetical protein VP01_9228g1 [Puccinia sorghi]
MHNWYKGVLQHHFRYRWNINGRKEQEGERGEDEELEHNGWTSNTTGSNNTDLYFLSDQRIKELLKLISDVVVPTGITPMPQGLGMAKNGKLEASEWYSLFVFHLPLTCINIFLNSTDIDQGLVKHKNELENICSLIECTHIDLKPDLSQLKDLTEPSLRLTYTQSTLMVGAIDGSIRIPWGKTDWIAAKMQFKQERKGSANFKSLML